MSSGLRRVELVEWGVSESQADIQKASHVVGIDESGNGGSEPFVMAAVQCPRSRGEELAELLIEAGLEPWKSKSSSSPAHLSNEELTERVRDLIDSFEETPVTWHAVAGWGPYNKEQRGAIAAMVSSKAMTGGNLDTKPEYEGPAALIHDGGGSGGLYGTQQITFRQYASRQFQGFEDRVTPVYLAFLQDGDKTYPEITAADYIAGYLKSEIERFGIGYLNSLVQRINSSWRASNETPMTHYQIRSRTRRRHDHKQQRIAAWIDGRRTPKEGAWGERPLKALVDRLESDEVKDYILSDL